MSQEYHSKLYQDPQINYPIYDFDLSFLDYIKQSETIISNTRQDLQEHRDMIIKANAPFELKPDNPNPKCGALLIHGLLDSPFLMRDIGQRLQAQGMLVRSIMLPGHGTVPGALLNTDYAEWLQAVSYGVNTLKQDVDKIFLVGFSTGATLSMYNAVEDSAISGIIMLAPALKINSPIAFMSDWFRKWGKIYKPAKWFYLGEEFNYVKYQSVTFNSIYQVYQLGKDLEKINLKKIANFPIFMALSYEDKIVCSRTSLKYFQQNTNPLSRTLLYSGKPLAFDDKRIFVKNSAYPDDNIINFSHITLPFAPNNPHYGKNGTYKLASHLEKHVKYGAYDKLDSAFFRLLYQLGLTHFLYQRLTFNPDFDFMQKEMNEFIENVTRESGGFS